MSEAIKIQILGTGCPKCEQLAANAAQAVDEMGIDCTIEKVSDITEITKFGVMFTPAIAIDGVVKVSGKVPDVDALKSLLK